MEGLHWPSPGGPGSKQVVPRLQDSNVPPTFPYHACPIFSHLVFATSLLSPESLAKASRLQHSVHFCGIQVRGNSQNEQKVWSEAENGERDWDLRYTKLILRGKKTDCFAVSMSLRAQARPGSDAELFMSRT